MAMANKDNVIVVRMSLGHLSFITDSQVCSSFSGCPARFVSSGLANTPNTAGYVV